MESDKSMSNLSPANIKNIGIFGHGTSGKTTLSEAILYNARITTRQGEVDKGNTLSDYTDQEMKRKISISAALLSFKYKDKKINLIDTPGYVDFIGEIYRTIPAIETAIIVINAQSGIEAMTSKCMRLLEDKKVLKAFFINKLDKENVDYLKVLESLQTEISNKVIPLMIPIGTGPQFKGVVDILTKKVYGKDGKEINESYDENLLSTSWEKLKEAVAESDEELMEKYFEDNLSDEEVLKGLPKAIATGSVMPVFCGSALQNVGVSTLVEYMASSFPAASFIEKSAGEDLSNNPVERKMDVSEPFSAFVFKTLTESHIGELIFIKVLSGSLKSGDMVLNTRTENKEKIGQIYEVCGKNRKDVGAVSAGDIVALVKLKDTKTNDTLCLPNEIIKYPEIEFPEHVIAIAINPKTKADQEKCSTALAKICEDDPTLNIEINHELKQTFIYGMGELHLDVAISRLQERYKVDITIEKPRVPYRETIKKKAKGHYRHKKQTGGRGQYGEVYVEIEPLTTGENFEFVDAIVGGRIPSKYLPSVEKGIVEAMARGILAGYPVIKVKATCYDGSYHDVDSSDLAFKIAGSKAFQLAAKEASPVILEPIYDVEVLVPEEFMGDVIGDLNGRRGRIMGMDPVASGWQKISAQVPLAEMHRYINDLRSMTQAKGEYTMKFSHYEEVPANISQEIIETARLEHEEEE